MSFLEDMSREKRFFFVQDLQILMPSQGNVLSLQEFRNECNLNVNFLHYCQISIFTSWTKWLLCHHNGWGEEKEHRFLHSHLGSVAEKKGPQLVS